MAFTLTGEELGTVDADGRLAVRPGGVPVDGGRQFAGGGERGIGGCGAAGVGFCDWLEAVKNTVRGSPHQVVGWLR